MENIKLSNIGLKKSIFVSLRKALFPKYQVPQLTIHLYNCFHHSTIPINVNAIKFFLIEQETKFNFSVMHHTEKSDPYLILINIQLNCDCNHTFPFDLSHNEIPFGVKSIGKLQLQSKFSIYLIKFINLIVYVLASIC